MTEQTFKTAIVGLLTQNKLGRTDKTSYWQSN